MFGIVTIVAVVVAGSAGCGDDGAANTVDAACVGATGCNGPCERGNELGVGAFCTPGGGECANTPSRAAPFCTVDTASTDLAFCTRTCLTNEDCGTNARCASANGSGPMGCFPIFCEASEDAGVSADAAEVDAMTE